ncbi:MAG TPA: ParB N-terminal domain-containing protein [Sphingomicrobium sp.]
MTVARAYIKLLLNKIGYEVRPLASPASLEIVPEGADPVTYEYHAKRRGLALFDVWLRDVRSFNTLALPLTVQCNPFVRALAAALHAQDEKGARTQLEAVLSEFYEKVQPSCALDLLGVRIDQAPGLRSVPPRGSVPPWYSDTTAEYEDGWRHGGALEALQNGLIWAPDIGTTHFGPARPEKISLEAKRLMSLLRSVRRRGFIHHQPRAPLQVNAHRRDGEYRWVITGGEHRLALAKVLGVEHVLAMVTRVIRREDSAYWPNVANGLYTHEGALRVFDRIFDGEPAPICQRWLSG